MTRRIGAGGVLAVLVALSVLLMQPSMSPDHSLLYTSTNQGRQRAVECTTTKGNFRVNLTPHLAPNGTRFLWDLVGAGYFNQPKEKVAFFRVNRSITQFGVTKERVKENDPFAKWRKGADRDENPFGGVGDDDESVARRKQKPWPRGTFASIGGHHFVVVIQPSK
jgi:hypothetical protein